MAVVLQLLLLNCVVMSLLMCPLVIHQRGCCITVVVVELCGHELVDVSFGDTSARLLYYSCCC